MEKRTDRMITILEKIFQLLLVKFSNEQSYSNTPKANSSNESEIDLKDELFSAQEVMSLLKIGNSTYYRFVKKGILKPVIISKRHYYPKSHIVKLLSLPKYKYR